ncbi:MAG TPA: aldehyde dehydrogenase family protein, partial [Chitinophagales bacterium]|nr:aldehyde dehydrogenase family protein [Chitinophagales bacterium]
MSTNNMTQKAVVDTAFLQQLHLQSTNAGVSTGQNSIFNTTTATISSYSPVDGRLIGKVSIATPQDYETVVATAQEAFGVWRMLPAPKRGEIVRQYGNKLREYKDALGRLVSYEMGKSLQE